MKRTLALVLALVMVIGMMAVPASADFSDAAEIQYVEAVDVVAACGIIEGDGTGNFNPAGELTRAAGAKLVAYLELGAKAAEALTAAEDPFEDVPADHWAAGYIGWAAGKGYLNGVGEGKFAPDAPLTALAYAKLMLCALGYDAAVEGYTGSGWEYNVLSDALDVKLFAGNDDANMSAVATREEAALYTFNALNAKMVKYEGGTGTKIEINGAVIATGAGELKELTKTLADERYDKLDKKADKTDDFGRPATTWYYNKEKVGTYADEPVVTYTADVKASAIKDDLDGYEVATAFNEDGTVKSSAKIDVEKEATSAAVLYINSKTASDSYLLKSTTSSTMADALDKYIANGRAVEVYANDDDVITNIVIVDTYVGKISDWKAADEDKDTKEYVKVTPIGSVAVADGGKFETEAFEKADKTDKTVVLFTVADKAIKSVVAAESVTAFVEETSGSSIVADGETYKLSLKNEGTYEYVKDADDTVIYLDTYGFAIWSDNVPDAEKDYAYVLGLDTASAVFEDSEYAKLLMPTGEVVVVEYDKDESDTIEAGKVVTYTVDEDVYTLKNTTVAKYSDTVAIDNGKTAATLAEGVTNLNNASVVVVEDKDENNKSVYTAYTGYKNVPTLDTATGEGAATKVAVVPVLGENDAPTKTANIVFVIGSTIDESVDADKLIYIAYASESDLVKNSKGEYYVYNAIVEGEATTVMVEKADKLSADGLYKSMTTNSKGIITELVPADRVVGVESTVTGTAADDEGQIGLGSALMVYDEDTVVYTVDSDGVIEESSVEAIADDDNDTVIYSYDKDNAELVVCVYITVVED